MNTPLLQATAVYRIGAVSKLSGIPVPTLRVWQTRYGAFTPTTTQGQHRLYSEDDLRKAALLKSLTAQGHGISRIAGLPILQLQQLLQTGSGIATAQHNTATHSQNAVDQAHLSGSRAWVVVGHGLAKRLQSPKTEQGGAWASLPLQQVWADLAEALRAVFVWILRGAEAPQLFKKPNRFAIRFGLVCRILGLNRFENLNLSDMAKLSGMTRAAISKTAISFRDSMGSPHLVAAGDREHARGICKAATDRSWAKRKGL